MVWETTYESVAAYGTYMTHPYHASVLDRFLLPDCPERITTHNALGAGPGRVRHRTSGPARRGRRPPAGAPRLPRRPDAAAHWADEVASAGADGLLESVLAENTMSTRWFDGVTDMGGRPAWTHIWDQCFATPTHLERHRTGAGAAAHVERALLAEGGSGASRSAEIVYVPETAPVTR